MARPENHRTATSRTTFIAACLALALASPAAADLVHDGVAVLPGEIEDVRIAGTWDQDDQSGFYRIAIARAGINEISARMFVQWVAFQPDGNALLMDTIEITELTELGVDIIDYISESDPDGLTVYIQTDGENGDESFELFVFGTDDYMFGPASN